ncbi:putative disease resistance protein RGA1 isoform X2 [Papaver somniferum]|nr:putative disease resistance protein RGA1 isoform X2 [Papaver somniferum]
MLTTTNVSSAISSQSSFVNSNQYEKVSVISIVGMGGLGKTSLAQSIYNDDSVENMFMKRMRICVSDDFNLFTILRNIMESITAFRCQDISVEVLVKNVTEKLEDTKYLLVIDDLWNEDQEEWDKLKSILDVGAAGSKILVTTRIQKVASVVEGLIPPYYLDLLSAAECWSIIKRIAFSPGGASETLNMKTIGEQIAKKCKGLPLAAHFFSRLMRSQNDERDWLSIRDNKSLETSENHSGGIMPVLKLSYGTLPSRVKQCFAYCCLFPKDWEFNREALIQLWMAEGFIHPCRGGYENSLEDIGNDYFLCLLSSSFFQDVKKDDLGDIQTFKMHDLVHDLALSVAGSHDVSVLNAGGVKSYVSQVRRLQLIVKKKEEE